MSRAIEAFHGEKTLAMVAHRVSTVRDCDRSVSLQEGRGVATGTCEELMEACEALREMVRQKPPSTAGTPQRGTSDSLENLDSSRALRRSGRG